MTRLERPFESSLRTTWPLRAQLAATVLEHNGPTMLAEYLQTLERAFRIQAYLFTENGVEALGQAAPPSARQLAELAGYTGRMELQGTSRARGLAQPEAGPSGHRYVLVLLSEFPIGQSDVLVVPLLTVLLIGGASAGGWHGISRHQ